MKKNILASVVAALAMTASTALAVPTLQVGLPGANPGTYAPYVNSTDPSEDATAILSSSNGGTLLVGGNYAQDNGSNIILNIGGKYSGSYTPDPDITAPINRLDWTDVGAFDSQFNGKGAVIMASAFGTGSLQINSTSSFYSTNSYKSGFDVPTPPANHAPVQDATQWLFFDIGTFAKSDNTVPDFANPGTKFPGEIKSLSFDVSGFDWVHFDVFALVTEDAIDKSGGNPAGRTYWLHTYDEGNPGSHDVTWKNDGGIPPQEVVPEPGTFALLGLGMVALGLYRRSRHS